MGRTWRIGEVADRTGLTRRTLRHYDDLGLLVPAIRSSGDYRLYDEDDLLRLLQIQNLKVLGLSLPEIGTALADPDLDASTTLRSHLVQLEESVEAQRRLTDRLRALAATVDRSWEDVLGAIAMSAALAHPDPIVRIRAALDPTAASTVDLVRAMHVETDQAVREVLMWSLAQHGDALEAALDGLRDPDPELRCLKQSYQQAFDQAFPEALASLSVRQRNLLRQHHLDGLRIGELAALYRVHRVTAARWLAEAREELLLRLEKALVERGVMTPGKLPAVVELLESRLSSSLGRYLKQDDLELRAEAQL